LPDPAATAAAAANSPAGIIHLAVTVAPAATPNPLPLAPERAASVHSARRLATWE